MTGLLGPLLIEDTDAEADSDRAWIANVRAQWELAGAYPGRRREPSRANQAGEEPQEPIDKVELWKSHQRVFLAFNDIFATLGLEAELPHGRFPGREGLRAAVEFAPPKGS